jgi:U6 snRNA-associated Sm-like protein LSm7
MSSNRVEKDAVVDFAKYCDLRVRVQFQGGREVDGILRGFDKLDNLVLEDAVEYLRGIVDDDYDDGREMMLVMIRMMMMIMILISVHINQ